MAVVAAYEGWLEAVAREGGQFRFCDDNFLSPSSMRTMHGLKAQVGAVQRWREARWHRFEAPLI